MEFITTEKYPYPHKINTHPDLLVSFYEMKTFQAFNREKVT